MAHYYYLRNVHSCPSIRELRTESRGHFSQPLKQPNRPLHLDQNSKNHDIIHHCCCAWKTTQRSDLPPAEPIYSRNRMAFILPFCHPCRLTELPSSFFCVHLRLFYVQMASFFTNEDALRLSLLCLVKQDPQWSLTPSFCLQATHIYKQRIPGTVRA